MHHTTRIRRWQPAVALAIISMLHWQQAVAQLTANQAVFTDITGNCGVVDFDGVSLIKVHTFTCGESEGIDITSDGARAVITHPFSDEISLWDLTPLPAGPPTLLAGPMAAGVTRPEEVDIAADDSFGIVVGTFDGAVARFEFSPSFTVTQTRAPEPSGCAPGTNCNQREDVHLASDGSSAVIPQFNATDLLDLDASALNNSPALFLTTVGHHGVSLSENDNDTVLATVALDTTIAATGGVTVASRGSHSVTTTLPTALVSGIQTAGESVDIKCDGSWAVVELSDSIESPGSGTLVPFPIGAGLMWIDTSNPAAPVILSPTFGVSRADAFSTSTAAFSNDGQLLFVGGGEDPLTQGMVDVYDATVDPPTFLATMTIPIPLSPAPSSAKGTAPPGEPEFPNVNLATLPCEPPDVEPVTGRMTGGGSFFNEDDTSSLRFTHGFTLRCDAEPNNLQINWGGNGNGRGRSGGAYRFHLEDLTSAMCIDNPDIDEAPPVAGFDTFVGTGFGRLNGVSGAAISFTFTDAGEPGKNGDTATVSITPPGGAPIVVSGTLMNGNHQAHP